MNALDIAIAFKAKKEKLSLKPFSAETIVAIMKGKDLIAEVNQSNKMIYAMDAIVLPKK